MTATKHVYDFTYETYVGDAVTGSLEARVHFTFSPSTPDTYNSSVGGPGGWEPGNSEEIEITSVKQEEWVRGVGKDTVYKWVTINEKNLVEALCEYAYDKCMDNMRDEALIDRQDQKEYE